MGCICVIGTPYTMPVAFLPPVANQLGLDEAQIGLILSSYAYGVVLTSILAGEYMHFWNKKKVLVLSHLLLIFGLIIFSSLVYVKSSFVFQLLGVTARLIQGVSGALIYCILFSLIPKFYPDTLQQKLALMEVASGSGIGIGPVIGSIIYNLTGFTASFLSIALILLLFLLVLIRQDLFSQNSEAHAPLHKTVIKTYSGAKILSGNKPEHLTYSSLSKSSRMIFSYIMLTMMATSFSIISPVFSLFVKEKYDIDPSGASLVLSICMAFYVIPSFFTEYIMNPKYDRRMYIIFGVVSQSLGLILISGSFFLAQKLYLLVIGLILLGFGTYLSNIPAIPELMDICREVHPLEESDIVSDFASGMYNGLWGIVEFLGPILGGVFTKYFGFNHAIEIYSLMLWASLASYIYFGRGLEAFQGSYMARKKSINNQLL